MNESLGHIFVDSLLINNFVLAVFLGMCPFLGLSSKFQTAWRMGVTVIFVITVSSILAFGTNLMLVALHAEYLRLISFIVIIAATVQLTEMIIKKASPALFRELGIYLPLITTNCAVLAVALFQTVRNYNFIQSTVYAVSASGGFCLAIVLLSLVRERVELSDVPSLARGTALTLVLASILSMAFMGFAGMGGGG
ncbi:MAG: RnfABCDGE type electron transport complex subunit A [Bryobacterales bacterium]|nr:RnfABCDGE type electron transport complex subunit A [Bryobacterales bacterium]